MAHSPARRTAILVLLLALLTGWSGQALSLVLNGVCVVPMDMSPTAPVDQDDPDAAAAPDPMPPCEGIAPRCANSIGCVTLVGLPQAEFSGVPAPPSGDQHSAAIHDMSGLALEPELTPPIAAV